MNLILFGFKGSGKTFTGKMISSYLKVPFVDTDDLMERQQGLSVREIHQKVGEKAFRELERKVILGLEGVKESVIALGGGSVENPKNIAFIQTLGTLVYLRASFETVKMRILNQGIPSFVDQNDPVASLKDMYLKRVCIYESIKVGCTIGV